MDEQLKPYHAAMQTAKQNYNDAAAKLQAAHDQLKTASDAFIAAVKTVHGVPEFPDAPSQVK